MRDWCESRGCCFRSSEDYYSRCFHEFWLAAVVARCRLRKLLNRSLLKCIQMFEYIVSFWSMSKCWKVVLRNKRWFDVPIELRLLLSPESEWVSPALMMSPLMLDVGVSVLVGRDRRRSLSTSDRRGRFGVNWKEIEKSKFNDKWNTFGFEHGASNENLSEVYNFYYGLWNSLVRSGNAN